MNFKKKVHFNNMQMVRIYTAGKGIKTLTGFVGNNMYIVSFQTSFWGWLKIRRDLKVLINNIY